MALAASASRGLPRATEEAPALEAAVPLLLCSAPGHDASGQVDALAAALNRKVASVAMGSSEGYGGFYGSTPDLSTTSLDSRPFHPRLRAKSTSLVPSDAARHNAPPLGRPQTWPIR